jgi:hypothetical protein
LDNNWSPIKEKENGYRKRKSGGYQKLVKNWQIQLLLGKTFRGL